MNFAWRKRGVQSGLSGIIPKAQSRKISQQKEGFFQENGRESGEGCIQYLRRAWTGNKKIGFEGIPFFGKLRSTAFCSVNLHTGLLGPGGPQDDAEKWKRKSKERQE